VTGGERVNYKDLYEKGFLNVCKDLEKAKEFEKIDLGISTILYRRAMEMFVNECLEKQNLSTAGKRGTLESKIQELIESEKEKPSYSVKNFIRLVNRTSKTFNCKEEHYELIKKFFYTIVEGVFNKKISEKEYKGTIYIPKFESPAKYSLDKIIDEIQSYKESDPNISLIYMRKYINVLLLKIASKEEMARADDEIIRPTVHEKNESKGLIYKFIQEKYISEEEVGKILEIISYSSEAIHRQLDDKNIVESGINRIIQLNEFYIKRYGVDNVDNTSTVKKTQDVQLEELYNSLYGKILLADEYANKDPNIANMILYDICSIFFSIKSNKNAESNMNSKLYENIHIALGKDKKVQVISDLCKGLFDKFENFDSTFENYLEFKELTYGFIEESTLLEKEESEKEATKKLLGEFSQEVKRGNESVHEGCNVGEYIARAKDDKRVAPYYIKKYYNEIKKKGMNLERSTGIANICAFANGVGKNAIISEEWIRKTIEDCEKVQEVYESTYGKYVDGFDKSTAKEPIVNIKATEATKMTCKVYDECEWIDHENLEFAIKAKGIGVRGYKPMINKMESFLGINTKKELAVDLEKESDINTEKEKEVLDMMEELAFYIGEEATEHDLRSLLALRGMINDDVEYYKGFNNVLDPYLDVVYNKEGINLEAFSPEIRKAYGEVMEGIEAALEYQDLESMPVATLGD